MENNKHKIKLHWGSFYQQKIYIKNHKYQIMSHNSYKNKLSTVIHKNNYMHIRPLEQLKNITTRCFQSSIKFGTNIDKILWLSCIFTCFYYINIALKIGSLKLKKDIS